MSGPFTSPVAQSVPFQPNRNGSDIEALNVQDAIEEAKLDAINNDRFILLCSYNGNANTGRYFEFFPGIDSSIAPISLVASARCLSVTVGASSNSNATVGFYDLNVSSTTPIYTINMQNQSKRFLVGSPLLPLFVSQANANIAVRVVSGSISKPYMFFTLSANT